MHWEDYKPYFFKSEFDCKHTGKNRTRPEFMDILYEIRKTYGRPMIINSGYRHETHPIEAAKAEPGEHFYGIAADIAVTGLDRLDIVVIAYGYGIRRIGVAENFVHIGIGDQGYGFQPAFWTY